MSDYAAGKVWKQEKQQRILDAGFKLFSERGIEPVTMPEVAQAGGVGRATLFRYYPSKLELVIAIGAWKWEEYIKERRANVSPEARARMTGAERLRLFMDSFVDLFRNHSDILRFNYNFNSFLHYETTAADRKQPYLKVVENLGEQFHALYQRGIADGTLNAEISEQTMFTSSFHIMLAAATRYAVGLVIVEKAGDPESELWMLEELLLSRFTVISPS